MSNPDDPGLRLPATRERRAVLARLALDALEQIVLLLDARGRVLDANEAALRSADLPLADVTGLAFVASPWCAMPEAVFAQALARALSGEAVACVGGVRARDALRDGRLRRLGTLDGEPVLALVPAPDIPAAAESAPLARSLVHDLRNAVSSIRHGAAIARLPNATEAQASWAREMIERQADQLARLLDTVKPGQADTAPAPALVAEPRTTESLPMPAQSLRILVADDNRDNADSCSALLAMIGHDVRTAYSGLEAVAVADVFRPQVALIDLGMPGANGYEVARRLRARSWGAQAVLIAVTGWGKDEDRRQAETAGFDHHLVKPVELQQIEPLLQARDQPEPPAAASQAK